MHGIIGLEHSASSFKAARAGMTQQQQHPNEPSRNELIKRQQQQQQQSQM